MAKVESTVTIVRPVEDVFRHFLDLDKYATDRGVESVVKEPEGRLMRGGWVVGVRIRPDRVTNHVPLIGCGSPAVRAWHVPIAINRFQPLPDKLRFETFGLLLRLPHALNRLA